MNGMMHGNLATAFLLTLMAGLSTGLGSLVVILSKKPSLKMLSFGLGFSGGVMVFVSLVELLPHAKQLVGEVMGRSRGDWIAYGCFFGGILMSRLLDALVPDPEKNPHEMVPELALERVTSPPPIDSPPVAACAGDGIAMVPTVVDHPAPPESGALNPKQAQSLARAGLLTAIVIAIHNFPEGMATLITAVSDYSIGLSVAIAVAIHNIPEGISVAVLVYFATRSRTRAVALSFASGLAEPLGAGVIYLVLSPFITPTVVAGMMAAVAGIMVFISFDELLPTAREYGNGHIEIMGIVLGMAVMAVSLALF